MMAIVFLMFHLAHLFSLPCRLLRGIVAAFDNNRSCQSITENNAHVRGARIHH